MNILEYQQYEPLAKRRLEITVELAEFYGFHYSQSWEELTEYQRNFLVDVEFQAAKDKVSA